MPGKITAPQILAMKGSRQKIVCITAYDAVTARIADDAGVDVILVGDSVGNVMLGYPTTLQVTLEAMVHHTAAAARAGLRALLVADMPFGSYHASSAQAVDSAVALVRAGAEAVKLEGPYVDAIQAIVNAGVPVMGHVGLTPQSIHQFGGHKVQGKGDTAMRVTADAISICEAGAFSIVLELVPATLSSQITQKVGCPTVGIGAGSGCDGQIQVFHDVVGLTVRSFKHAKHYCDGMTAFTKGISQYADEVRGGQFPTEENSF